jgi:DNA polymerase-3 subunit alpha
MVAFLMIKLEDIEEITESFPMDGWDDINPREDRAGVYYDPDGKQHVIHLNDPEVIRIADEQKVDAVFQFDTPLAKSILANGVRNFEDLMLYSGLGHPGPMQCIPEAVANRDDPTGSWKKKLYDLHPIFLEVLEPTYGVICYQEQLQALWQRVAGFTAPEAQDARKSIAKKWVEKLKPIREKWITGATHLIGEEEANNWWNKMQTFGRYAFNRCLGKDTLLTDTNTGLTQTVEQWYYYKNSEYPKFRSYDNGTIIEDSCINIHENGEMDVFEIEFEDGTKETVTLDHKYLCMDNQYHEVREIIERGLDVTRIRTNSQ